MPVFNLDPRTSPEFYEISSALTDMVNAAYMADKGNKLVSVFSTEDNPDWASLPPIWHRPNGVDIVINMGKFEQVMASTSDKPGYFLSERMGSYADSEGSRYAELTYRTVRGEKLPAIGQTTPGMTRDILRSFTGTNRTVTPSSYRALEPSGKVSRATNPGASMLGHCNYAYHPRHGAAQMLGNLLIGAVLREASYSIFNQRQVREAGWFKRATGYEQNIITVLEELRVENQALKRYEDRRANRARNYVRTATSITANVDQVVADMAVTVMSGGEEGASLANIALNSSLILGRTVFDILLRHEVKDFRDGVANFVGDEALEKMHSIWERYVAITDATEKNIMPLIEEWKALFPSSEDGSNAKSSVAPSPGDGGEGEGEGEGEGKSDGQGEANGEDGDGEGSGQGEGDQEGDGQGEGEGDKPSDGEGGQGKGEGKAGEGSGKQQKRPDTLTDAKGASADAKGTKGEHAKSFNVQNSSRKNSDRDPGKERLVGSKDLVESMVAPKSPADLSRAAMENFYINHDYGPRDMTPSRISYAQAQHRQQPVGPKEAERLLERGRIMRPTPQDYAMAQQLGKVLENLNVSDRGKFTVADAAPPGRLRGRAAVQQAAERAMRLPATAKPWERTKRTVDLNPPLTVGIMTDISGSMGWAETFVAEFTWIVQHAVSTINGRAAALAFGNGATVTLRPGEKMQYAQVVEANGSGEEFDMGIGTLDVMLNLGEGQGTRLLFVVTDGNFVFSNMMPKSRAWIDYMTRKGVHIIWVTPNEASDDARKIDGFRVTPEKVTVVRATDVQRMSYYGADEKELQTATRKLMVTLGNEIQKSVRAARTSRR